jgi:hypothetical protein
LFRNCSRNKASSEFPINSNKVMGKDELIKAIKMAFSAEKHPGE